MTIKYDGWELIAFDKANNFRKYQLQLISKFIAGNTAEIGPGRGSVVSNYIKKIKSLDLYEPSSNLYYLLKKRYKLSKKIKVINNTFKKNQKKFNTIIYFDVLEHIQDDKDEINIALNNLKKNGHLIINVPAFNQLYSEFDKEVGHFKRYQKKDFKKILQKEKYQKIEMKYYDSIGFILALLSKVFKLNFKKNFKDKIVFWNNLIPLSKIFDKLTFNLFGKSLMIVIKK
ncbi:class I SAM-dependent methyltransferase [Candidatus Pelagibacter ubique]|nr:class I SAM-dependent methyltransferase [Candidatus Pelagibacter ubique]